MTPAALLSIHQMLIARHVMVALLMSPTDPNIDVIDSHIKVFFVVLPQILTALL